MKKILLLLLLLVAPNFVFAAGSIKVSTYNITITEGSSSSFKVTASNAAGKVDIASSNSGVATVSSSGFWIENQTNTVTVYGKSVGSTTIRVILADAATFDSEELTGSYTINVTVKAKPTTNNSGSNNSGGSTNQNNTNVVSKSSDNTLKNIIIDGYKLNFKSNVTSYNLDVANNVTSLNVKAEVNHSKATVKVNNVELKEGNNKIEIVVTAENGSKKTYTINVNRKVDSDTVVLSDLDDTLNNTKHDKIYVLINKDEIISKNVLEKIKDSNIEVYVRMIDNDKILYEWKIEKSGIKGDLNPNIDFSNNDKIDIVSNYTKGKHFKLSSDILVNNKIKMYVGDYYKDGELLYLYNDELKSKGTYKVEDGYVELNITDSNGYLITNALIQKKNNLFMVFAIVELFVIVYLILDKFIISKTKKKSKKKGR